MLIFLMILVDACVLDDPCRCIVSLMMPMSDEYC